MKFRDWVKKQREDRDWKTGYCAERAGVQQPVWTQWEREDNEPRMPRIKKIADVFQIPVIEVLRAAFPAEMQDTISPSIPMPPDMSPFAFGMMLSELSHEDQAKVYNVALPLWEHSKQRATAKVASPRNNTSQQQPASKSRVQYDLEDHKVYALDGKQADETLTRTFLLDVASHLIHQSISEREEALIADPR